MINIFFIYSTTITYINKWTLNHVAVLCCHEKKSFCIPTSVWFSLCSYEYISLKLLMSFDLAFQMKCKYPLLEDDQFPLQTVQRKCLLTTMMFNVSSLINLGTIWCISETRLLIWMGYLFPSARHRRRNHLIRHIDKSQILTSHVKTNRTTCALKILTNEAVRDIYKTSIDIMLLRVSRLRCHSAPIVVNACQLLQCIHLRSVYFNIPQLTDFRATTFQFDKDMYNPAGNNR